MKPTTTLILLGLGLLSCGQQVRADVFTYRNGVYTIIDVPPGAYGVEPHGINNAGQIVGSLFDSTGLHGFIDTNGVFTNLPDGTDARGINNAGQVVGLLGTTQGFLWDKGVFTTFDVPGALINQIGGINDAGQIVGTYYHIAYLLHGFLDTNGVFTTIDFPGVASGTGLDGINNSGQIVGNLGGGTGFLDANGVFTTIRVPGSDATFVQGINNAGQVVGFYAGQGGDFGFLDTNGVFTTLHVPVPGTFSTDARGINDSGEIVGVFSVPPPSNTPEPSSLLLIACGLAALGSLSKLKRV